MSLNILDQCGIQDILAGGTPPLPVFYHRNGAPKNIVDLVGLSNKRFGTDMETMVCRMTGCHKVPDTIISHKIPSFKINKALGKTSKKLQLDSFNSSRIIKTCRIIYFNYLMV